MTQRRSAILGIGGYLPPRVVTNDDLSKLMDTTHEWIVERTGIHQRHWVDPGESGAGMGAKASEKALAMAGVAASEIDLIVFATLSADASFPGNGVFMQRIMGMAEIPALDIRQQCSGFIYALSVADAYIRAGMAAKVLVVGAEIHSTGMDISTSGRDVSVLFGDGAGAVVMGVSEGKGHELLSTHIHADGRDAEILWMEKPGALHHPRITHEDLDRGLHYPQMEGRKVFKHAVTRMPQVIMEGLAANGAKMTDIDLLVPHQANLRINEMVAKGIGIPLEKVHNNIHKVGNTTAASIPLCLLDALDEGKLQPGNLLCLVAFGAGLTWGSAFVRW